MKTKANLSVVPDLAPLTLSEDEVMSKLRHPSRSRGMVRTYERKLAQGESAWLPGSPNVIEGPSLVRYFLAQDCTGPVTYEAAMGR